MTTAEAYFHRCPPDPDCPYCKDLETGGQRGGLDWSFLDGAYCISLQSRDDRAERVARELHRVGLCQQVVFYRPVKHPTSSKKGIWASHQAVAREARDRGRKRVLILEDDVVFARSFGARALARIRRSFEKLPPQWMCFFLGHWPIWGRFVTWRVLRSYSYCAHAYIASERLIDWLCNNPHSKNVPRSPLAKLRLGGKGIDAAFVVLPHMYAYFPMVALQDGSLGDHKVPNPRREKLRDYILNTRLRDAFFHATMMRPFEFAVVAISPLASIVSAVGRALKPSAPSGRSA